MNDLKFAFRQLLKNPGFSAVAVLTLALGIGANGVIFNVVNALLLRPLPVGKPHELAAVFTSDFSSGDFGSSSYPDFVGFRARNQSFAELTAYQPQSLSLRVGEANERVFGEIVSANYFTTLGLKPALGRSFLPEEDEKPGVAPVAIISHKLWQTHFGGDPTTLGRAVKLNGLPFTIVGVAPKDYRGLVRGVAVDWWVPMLMMDQMTPGVNNLTERSSRGLMMMGRLKRGITVARAQAEFNVLAAQFYQQWPQAWENVRGQGRSVSVLPESEARVMPEMRTPLMLFSVLLMTVVALVLLIACANVTNLLLSRAAARRKEIAIRQALGAGRWRLMRQLLTESLLLALLGGGAGLLLAAWGAKLLMLFKPPVPVPVELNLQTDWRVYGFLLGLSVLTGIVFGLAPALAASRPEVVAALKGDEGGGSGCGHLRGALVVVQVGVSVPLLIAAGLFLRSLQHASTIDPGFDASNLLVVSMDLRQQGYDRTRGAQFTAQLLERTRALPGVVAASVADSLPLGLGASRRAIAVEDYQAQPGEVTEAHSAIVAPGYFETLRIPLLQGRSFEAQDHDTAPGVIVINEAFARRFWPGQAPLGKRIQRTLGRGTNTAPYLTVVGVVKDGKYNSLGEDALPFFYLNHTQQDVGAPTLIVRTQGDPMAPLAQVRRGVELLDKALPLYDVKTMREHLGIALLPARLAGSALGTFGLVALLLASAGIYGVVAYSVSQRTREIGIRMALGADRMDVLRLIVRHGLRLTLLGLAAGLMGALFLSRVLQAHLYEVGPSDPLTFATVALLVVLVALLACWLPARRAARVDPMEALRSE